MIEGQINMGAGMVSLAQVGYLYQKLGEALLILGGIQQTPTCHETKEVFEQYQRDEEDAELSIKRIADEIYLGLTGRRPKSE